MAKQWIIEMLMYQYFGSDGIVEYIVGVASLLLSTVRRVMRVVPSSSDSGAGA